jgi:hypothetical protein
MRGIATWGWGLLALGATAMSTAHAACDGSGAVLINEFAADPAGTDSGAEWIELLNVGRTAATLEGWVIERALSGDADYEAMFTLPSGWVLAPGERLVIAGPAADVGAAADVVRLDAAVDLGNAGSSSDGLRLVTCSGAIRDVVVYGTTNTDLFTDESSDPIDLDRLAPKPSSGTSLARIPDGTDRDNGLLDFVRGTPTPGAANGGGGGGGGGGSCGDAGAPGKLVLNEVFADPGAATNPSGSSDSGYEWVEIYNPGGAPVDASGWRIEQAGAPDDWGTRIKVTLPAGTILPAGGFLLVADPMFPVPAGVVSVPVVDVASLSLGNSQDGVRLSDCAGAAVDTLVYGGANPDGFLDDAGVVLADDAVGPRVASDASIARRRDGASTGDLSVDWVVSTSPTPGSSNPDLSCRTATARVRINEILANPSGTDSDVQAEFVELFNLEENDVDLSTWTLVKVTSLSDGVPNEDTLFSFPPGSVLPAGGYLVVAGLLAATGDLFAEDFDLGSGTGGDLVRLISCSGSLVDGVLYGGDNDDGLPEDDGFVPDQGADRPSDDQCVARVQDGADTNVSAEDFVTTAYCTPGETNVRKSGGGGGTTVGGPEGGCGGGGGPRDVQAPTLGEGGCDAVGGRGPGLALLALLLLRRRGARR